MKAVFTIVIVVLLLSAYAFLNPSRNSSRDISNTLLSNVLTVTTFTDVDGVAGTKKLLQVHTLKENQDSSTISIAIDLNGDKIFTDDEFFIRNYPIELKNDWQSGYYISRNAVITDGIRAQVLIGNETYILTTENHTYNAGELLALPQTLHPLISMKGVPISKADRLDNKIFAHTYPDTTQNVGGCAPAVALNAFLLLSNTVGDFTVPTQTTAINELKSEMHWNTSDGVIPLNFVTGSNNWTKIHSIPVHTTEIGTVAGTTTLQAVRKSLRIENPVSLRIALFDRKGERVVGGHLVSVTGIYDMEEERTLLQVQDPLTGIGTEYLSIAGDRTIEYGPWSGISKVSTAFSHSMIKI